MKNAKQTVASLCESTYNFGQSLMSELTVPHMWKCRDALADAMGSLEEIRCYLEDHEQAGIYLPNEALERFILELLNDTVGHYKYCVHCLEENEEMDESVKTLMIAHCYYKLKEISSLINE